MVDMSAGGVDVVSADPPPPQATGSAAIARQQAAHAVVVQRIRLLFAAARDQAGPRRGPACDVQGAGMSAVEMLDEPAL